MSAPDTLGVAEEAATKRSEHADVAEAPVRRGQAAVRTIDFSRPIKRAPIEPKRFESAHAAFCRDVSMRLSTELRATIELEVINFAQLIWTTALSAVPQPSLIATVSCEPSATMILMCIEQPFVFGVIERLLGGGHADGPITRTMTEIDTALAQRVVTKLIDTLSVSWQDLLGQELALAELEPPHAGVDLVPPSEPTLALTIEARDGTASSTISLLTPYTAVEAAIRGQEAKESATRNDADETGEVIEGAIGAIDVELQAEISAIELTLGEVLALRAGDVVRLGATGNEGVFGGEQQLHRARPGRSGTRRAVQIIGRAGGGS